MAPAISGHFVNFFLMRTHPLFFSSFWFSIAPPFRYHLPTPPYRVPRFGTILFLFPFFSLVEKMVGPPSGELIPSWIFPPPKLSFTKRANGLSAIRPSRSAPSDYQALKKSGKAEELTWDIYRDYLDRKQCYETVELIFHGYTRVS